MSKLPIYFPFYHIYSPLVKSAIGRKDPRAIKLWFEKAGIPIHKRAGIEIVMCEDLINADLLNQEGLLNYEAKGSSAKALEELD